MTKQRATGSMSLRQKKPKSVVLGEIEFKKNGFAVLKKVHKGLSDEHTPESREEEEMSDRESKSGFVVDEGVLKEVIGYSCAPNNPDMWWCPTVGFSTSRFYSDKLKAIKEAKETCNRNIKLWQERLEKL